MLVAAAVCPASPLLARELTGTAAVVPELRQACAEAVAAALDSQADLVVVIGVAETADRWDPAGRLDLSLFAAALGRPEQQVPRLPPAVGLGAMLLDLAGYLGPRELYSVTEAEPAAACADLGARLAGQEGRVAMLVLADGSARRTLKAPGYLDERSLGFDDEVIRRLTGPDLAGLLAVDPELARELMATGRPAWQVLAGAAGGLRAATEVRYTGDPFGVFYLVASLAFAPRPAVARRAEIEETMPRKD